MTGTPPPPGKAEAPGPADFSDPLVGREFRRALVWAAVAVAIVLAWFLSQPLLLIFGGAVFASMLDGGVRLLGRVLPIRRALRLAFAGTQLAGQAQALQTTVVGQAQRLLQLAHQRGWVPEGTGFNQLGQQIVGSVAKVTAVLGSAFGALSSFLAIVIIGLFLAMEPRLYERGFAWMLPMENRADFYRTSESMGHTLRRLMAGRLTGMAAEGVFTGIALTIVGVPLSTLLGILTGLLAFLPNIGAIVSGGLTILVGFSAGTTTGLWAVAVYATVQMFDGYVVVPYVARKSVDLPPALVLGAQLLFGALFGILGLTLADPMVAMIKVLLETRSEQKAEGAGAA